MLVLPTALLLAACGGSISDPEAELRRWVDNAEAATEERDRRALMKLVSSAYVDGRGNDYERVNQMVRVYMLRQQSISLLVKIDSIVLSADTAADVELTVGMAGTNNQAFGLNADAYRFELELVREEDDWRLIGARWTELGGELR